MRIAHFCRFSPHAAGMYETVKDLIFAERAEGIEAEFIDCGTDNLGTVREGLVDGELKTSPLSWALENADVVVRHTSVPDSVYKAKPVILALHGRPENSFRLEQYDISPVISSVMKAARNGSHAAFFTFWPEFVFYWKWITGKEVYCVPAPVSFGEYTPEGKKHDFGEFKAGLNLVCCDMWREDNIPFNLIFAAQYFKERYRPDARLHVFGASNVKKGKQFKFLAPLQRKGVVGQVSGVVGNLADVYRSADILLTPNVIATRIIRESMASGLPCVAPIGCRYTDYTAEPRDYKAFALAINRCYESITPESKAQLRERALKLFDNKTAALAIKALCEKVLGSAKEPKWNDMSITKADWDLLKDFIQEHGIRNVTEFGAGISTELFSQCGCRVVSYETHEAWLEQMKRKVPGGTFRLWEGHETVSVSGDMAFIDGPHGGKNREAAYRSVFESKVPIVACHDAGRPEDLQWIDKYFRGWKELTRNADTVILERPC